MERRTAGANFTLNKPIVSLMAVICGVAVANLYYIQPLEAEIADTFGVSLGLIGLAAMATQVGYAFGLLLIVPIGDKYERRSTIMRMLGFVTIALLAVAWSPSYPLLLGALTVLGFTTIIPQLVIPYAAQLAERSEQGRIIGDVLSGLLIGILLSRTFSGILGTYLGWRVVYLVAAVLIIALYVLVKCFFPFSQPAEGVPYMELLKSIPALLTKQKVLRESAANGFFMFGSFSIFWTSLIFLLETPRYGMGPKEAGLFGLAGVAGALAAPIVGRIADEKSPRFAVGIGCILSTLAYLSFTLFGFDIWGLIIGVVILDLGNQFGQVANMARVQALGNAVRSRNNTVFMFFYFVGGAIGSFLGTMFWQYWGWYGVCFLGLSFQICALMVHFVLYGKMSLRL